MLDLEKVATVLDAAADHFDAIEAEKASSARAERMLQVDEVASKYAEATGEEMPEDVRQKLADTPKDVVAFLRAMTEKQAGAVESLGGPSSRNDDPAPKTIKEAAAAADQRFLNWVMS
jgi:anion-transporting  ArsA/GET3 family ATPase